MYLYVWQPNWKIGCEAARKEGRASSFRSTQLRAAVHETGADLVSLYFLLPPPWLPLPLVSVAVHVFLFFLRTLSLSLSLSLKTTAAAIGLATKESSGKVPRTATPAEVLPCPRLRQPGSGAARGCWPSRERSRFGLRDVLCVRVHVHVCACVCVCVHVFVCLHVLVAVDVDLASGLSGKTG